MNRALCFVLLAFGCASTTGASSTTAASPPPGAGASDASDAGIAGAASGAGATAAAPPVGTTAAASGPSATAAIDPRSGSTISGSSRFSKVDGGLASHVELQGATPGQHGVHVHEKGDCSDPKALSAGPHFNPASSPHHGGPTTPVRHGGDLGNITVDDSGKGVLDVVVYGLSLDGSDGVVGRAIVVHEKVDDLHSDPAGNSGGRIGCGVIKTAQQR
jgi:Cu-Zn family superoxide dismutase